MRNLPLSRIGTLDFVKSHMDLWAERAAELGLSAATTQEIIELHALAREAHQQAADARQAARAATHASNVAIVRLRAAAANAIAAIKAHEPSNPDVFVDAQIHAPLKPSRDADAALTPGTVRNASVVLTPQGRPVLTWKPPAPKDARERDRSSSGLVYTVRRIRHDASGRVVDDRIVATTGRTTFTDEPPSLSSGSTFYLIRATRGKRDGDWGGGLNVCFERATSMTADDRPALAAA